MKVIAFLFLLSSPVSAFTLISLNPNETGWATRTVNYKLNPLNCPSNIGDILNAATGIWNTVSSSSLIIKINGTSVTTPAQLKGQTAPDAPVIVCDSSFGTTTGKDPNQVPAVGLIGGQTQPINYGGIILNVQPGANDNINNLGVTLTEVAVSHEMGHSLGLGHSADPNALMYWDATFKTHLSLAQDDMDGITYLYPRNELGSDGVFGCGMISSQTNSSSPFFKWRWSLVLFISPILILMGLRISNSRNFQGVAG